MPNTVQHAQRLFSCRTYPLRFLSIPKCGCTFVKNLIWRLDHGENYADPPRIHDIDTEFARASEWDLSLEDIRAEPCNFVVLRSPVDRFYSLYSDKVVGQGYKIFVPLRQILQYGYGLNPRADTVEEHRRNCGILIEWIERNLRDRIDLEPNAHWTPQHYRFDVVRHFDLKILLLDSFNQKLTILLSDIVPDLPAILNEQERYSSKPGFSRDEILDQPLRARINQVYARDRAHHDKAREYWQSRAPRVNAEIPRVSDIFGKK